MKLVEPFWKSKSLKEMSGAEWEALCDGCARCCLVKFENPETERVEWTDVHCRHLSNVSCSCNIYNNGRSAVSDCVKLTPAAVAEIQYMPPTCAYRLLQEGRDLYWWHPLVSGDTETVHQAGISIRHKSISEIGLTIEDCLNRCLSKTGFA
ncbi:conserved hypothetical protein [Roseibium sp. TrichSKD4]|uniref:YcgN family cysteine cluster protein n=1 Tax=Roseibium sp. TrichSKD4 TaxID=744980 RepID=UPI0001E56A86|nr:YcgN family cysteine cluster protein [Roseibium sp. TrichSKD4]EFO31922.1 conserved hypothetical protein [Roseibium sp. TrichSKD4]